MNSVGIVLIDLDNLIIPLRDNCGFREPPIKIINILIEHFRKAFGDNLEVKIFATQKSIGIRPIKFGDKHSLFRKKVDILIAPPVPQGADNLMKTKVGEYLEENPGISDYVFVGEDEELAESICAKIHSAGKKITIVSPGDTSQWMADAADNVFSFFFQILKRQCPTKEKSPHRTNSRDVELLLAIEAAKNPKWTPKTPVEKFVAHCHALHHESRRLGHHPSAKHAWLTLKAKHGNGFKIPDCRKVFKEFKNSGL